MVAESPELASFQASRARHRWVSAALRRGGAALQRDRRGVTAIEYALIAGVIVVAIVTSVPGIAPSLETAFNTVSQKL